MIDQRPQPSSRAATQQDCACAHYRGCAHACWQGCGLPLISQCTLAMLKVSADCTAAGWPTGSHCLSCQGSLPMSHPGGGLGAGLASISLG